MKTLIITLILLFCVDLSASNIAPDSETKALTTNAFLLPLNNLQVVESELAKQIIDSIYAPFELGNQNNSEDALTALQTHLDFDHFKQYLHSLPDNLQEVMQKTLSELLDLDTLRAFQSPLEIEESVYHSLENLTSYVISILELNIQSHIGSIDLKTVDSVSLEISKVMLDDAIELIQQKIIEIAKEFKIDAKKISERFNELFRDNLTAFNDGFLDVVTQIIYLLKKPASFLKSQYVEIFNFSIREGTNNSEKRLEFIIRLISTFSDANDQIDQIFAFLFNFKRENPDLTPESHAFVSQSISSLFKLHFQGDKMSKGLDLLKYMTPEIVSTSVWDPNVLDFLSSFHTPFLFFENSSFMIMNYLLINEKKALLPEEYKYVVDNLDKVWTVTAQNQTDLEFANRFLANDLFNLERDSGFYRQAYSLLMDFLSAKKDTQTSDKHKLFNDFLDQRLNLPRKLLVYSDYFRVKLLNAVMSSLENSEFEFKFELSEKETHSNSRVAYEIYKNSALEKLVRKIHSKLISNPSSPAISIEDIIDSFFKTQFNSKDFRLATLSHGTDEYEIDFALTSDSEKRFVVEVEYNQDKSLFNLSEFFKEIDENQNLNVEEEVNNEIESNHSKKVDELPILTEEQEKQILGVRELDKILEDTREEREFEL